MFSVTSYAKYPDGKPGMHILICMEFSHSASALFRCWFHQWMRALAPVITGYHVGEFTHLDEDMKDGHIYHSLHSDFIDIPKYGFTNFR